ncbi:MAG: hypothetical protein BWY85_01829 [Firmicutes bacterium ADurb.Bin506]|nr:MAG: hypothetical protein BWY85_01829 [Firmicutes bacterium ADurb.Bin506]
MTLAAHNALPRFRKRGHSAAPDTSPHHDGDALVRPEAAPGHGRCAVCGEHLRLEGFTEVGDIGVVTGMDRFEEPDLPIAHGRPERPGRPRLVGADKGRRHHRCIQEVQHPVYLIADDVLATIPVVLPLREYSDCAALAHDVLHLPQHRHIAGPLLLADRALRSKEPPAERMAEHLVGSDVMDHPCSEQTDDVGVSVGHVVRRKHHRALARDVLHPDCPYPPQRLADGSRDRDHEQSNVGYVTHVVEQRLEIRNEPPHRPAVCGVILAESAGKISLFGRGDRYENQRHDTGCGHERPRGRRERPTDPEKGVAPVHRMAHKPVGVGVYQKERAPAGPALAHVREDEMASYCDICPQYAEDHPEGYEYVGGDRCRGHRVGNIRGDVARNCAQSPWDCDEVGSCQQQPCPQWSAGPVSRARHHSRRSSRCCAQRRAGSRVCFSRHASLDPPSLARLRTCSPLRHCLTMEPRATSR